MHASRLPQLPSPRRGEIWVARLGRDPSDRHWVVVVSVDARNLSSRVSSILIVLFSSIGIDGPTTLQLQPGESGLPGPSWLKAHFISTVEKQALVERLPRPLSNRRMREVSALIRRAYDPDAP